MAALSSPGLLAFLPLLGVFLAVTLVVGVAAFVAASFALARQGQGGSLTLPGSLVLLTGEFFSLLATLLMRPLGWLPPAATRGPSRHPPVILLHGLMQNRSSLLLLERRLRAAGYQAVSINTPTWLPLDRLIDRLAESVAAVRRTTGASQVHLVGHSMGGLLARCYLHRQHGPPPVAACVTIGSPHHGTELATLAFSRLGRALHPASPLLSSLNSAPPPPGVRLVSLYSHDDNLVVPASSATLEGALNIPFTGLGHIALLFSPAVARAVIDSLTPPAAEDP